MLIFLIKIKAMTETITTLVHPSMFLYIGTIGVLIGLFVVEMLSFLAGLDIFEMLNSIIPDLDFDADVDVDVAEFLINGGSVFKIMTWFSIGLLPFSLWLVIFLTVFSTVGIVLQSLALQITEAEWSLWVTRMVVLLLTFKVVNIISKPLGKALIKNQTSAVTVDSLIGRNGVIEYGTCTIKTPVKAKVVDKHGHPHYVMVRPIKESDSFETNDVVTLIEKCPDNIFDCAHDLTQQL